MSSEGSITGMINELRRGDPRAAQRIWELHFHRLVALARSRLRCAPRAAADEEDVALSAFDSFCRRAERGQFPRLEDRDDLWQLLVVLTVRKTIDLIRREGREKRRKGQALTLSELAGSYAEHEIDQALGSEPTPEMAAQVTDQCRWLLDRLGDEAELRAVALWKMEGYTNAESARKLGCVEHTVERKLRAIRRLWSLS
jgi:DNA-directed RNA polymerase specialized sigma24 family protein